jgi:DNA-binding NarL/FixJ family response regulator
MRRRVVVADDSPMYLELLAIVLGEMKQLDLVGTAADGREAIELAVDGDADIVLLDVEMPVLSGFAAAVEIRALRPQTVVVLHTARSVEEHRRRGDELNLMVYDKLELPRTIQLLARSPTPPTQRTGMPSTNRLFNGAPALERAAVRKHTQTAR